MDNPYKHPIEEIADGPHFYEGQVPPGEELTALQRRASQIATAGLERRGRHVRRDVGETGSELEPTGTDLPAVVEDQIRAFQRAADQATADGLADGERPSDDNRRLYGAAR